MFSECFGKYDKELNMDLYVSSGVSFSTSLLVNLLPASSASFVETNSGTVCLGLICAIFLLYMPSHCEMCPFCNCGIIVQVCKAVEHTQTKNSF